ncbi:uncharacterized protein OCT59_020877 [Rhizophagus irregularis]|uniref:F-box domain-containing protein n=1 Tax=Rhizophagus irregularis (strain DAOM 197198w) TaxID=1432141 RepID=A0A015IIT3_RHIIW|nr:hypothetical protein RirG_210500 [Rhizophagus irregularis DAOM 197198w]UZO02396.1 hypothetical protein OCT59_020877 [Rhizophagus irregularis]
MTYQIYIEEVLEFLENDKDTLYPCLFVNYFFCEVTVKVLWRNIWKFKLQSDASLQILNTLIACLPNTSKCLLYSKGIIIPTPTSKPPLFDYVSFCKSLSIGDISVIIISYFKNQQQSKTSEESKGMKKSIKLVIKEILKMYMNKINNLKRLDYILKVDTKIPYNIRFINFPRARDCLKNLTKLSCASGIESKFFHLLSTVCHNIQSLHIFYRGDHIRSEYELMKLIYSQNCLKKLKINCNDTYCWKGLIPSLKKHYNTLTKFYLSDGIYDGKPLLFITELINLQELFLLSRNYYELEYAILPKLRVLRIYGESFNSLNIFLENNGKNLECLECCFCKYIETDTSLNLDIA